MSAAVWERLAVAAGVLMGAVIFGAAWMVLAGRLLHLATQTPDTADDPESVSEAISDALDFAEATDA